MYGSDDTLTLQGASAQTRELRYQIRQCNKDDAKKVLFHYTTQLEGFEVREVYGS